MARKKFKLFSMIVLTFALVFVSACTGSGNKDNTAEPAKASSASPSAESSKAPAVPDGPFGKYDPPINVTTVRSSTPSVEYLPDQTLDDNVWYREFASELGINLKNKWTVNTAQYPSKITVTMVSGDMPDFFIVDMQQFQTLAQAGQLADLTEIYDKYASDTVKTAYNESGGIKLKAGTVDGKLLGMAVDGGSNDDAHSLYIRKDWMEKLGRTAPTTMDELMDLAIAFANEDPDGDGKKNTYGLDISKDIFGGFASIDGFLNGFGGYGFNPANGSGTNLIFLKGQDGKAIYADIQPEVKTALGKLADLFKAGAIHPEFSVMDGNKAGEMLTSSKVGMTYGAFWVPTWPINNMHTEDPSIDWGVYEAPSGTGSPTIVQSSGMPSRFMVVSKNSKNPEAMIKVMNYATEKLTGAQKDIGKYHTIKQGDKNYQIHTLAPIYAPSGEKNQNYHYQVLEALKKGDKSGLDEEAQLYYDQVKAYDGGDASQWVAHTLWDENGVFATLGKYKKNNRILMTAYTGAPTATMVAKGPALRDLEARAFTEIIMGAKPLDYFDEFAKQWLEQGGNDILAEINATGQVQ